MTAGPTGFIWFPIADDGRHQERHRWAARESVWTQDSFINRRVSITSGIHKLSRHSRFWIRRRLQTTGNIQKCQDTEGRSSLAIPTEKQSLFRILQYKKMHWQCKKKYIYYFPFFFLLFLNHAACTVAFLVHGSLLAEIPYCQACTVHFT